MVGLASTASDFRCGLSLQAFAVHVGSFSVEGMADFLSGLTTGATRIKPLDELPKIVSVEVNNNDALPFDEVAPPPPTDIRGVRQA